MLFSGKRVKGQTPVTSQASYNSPLCQSPGDIHILLADPPTFSHYRGTVKTWNLSFAHAKSFLGEDPKFLVVSKLPQKTSNHCQKVTSCVSLRNPQRKFFTSWQSLKQHTNLDTDLNPLPTEQQLKAPLHLLLAESYVAANMQHWKNPNSLSTAYAPSQLASQILLCRGLEDTPASPLSRPHEASEQSTGGRQTDVLLTDERAKGQVRDEREPMQNNKIRIQDKGPSVFSKFSSGRFLVSPQSI